MSKKSTFDKTREALGLPEGEYTQQQQALYNVVYKKLTAANEDSKQAILSLIASEQLNLKQVEAGMTYLQTHKFSEAEFKTQCGIGVTYTDEEIAEFCREILAPAPAAVRQKLFSSVSHKFPWAAAARLREIYDAMAKQVPAAETTGKGGTVPKEATNAKDGKDATGPAIPAELKLPTPEQLYALIPKDNRYTQLPEAQAAHDAFLASIDAKILTRFPPEPNGYLHLGHAKSMLINFGYAALRGGKTYLRLDDTNPEKECDEYVQKIEEMVAWLGHKPFKITHASDHFQRFYDIAEDMIRKGQMYVEDFSQEKQKEYREAKRDTPSRSRPPEESLRLFREMRLGLHPESSLTTRLKIDNTHDNPNMRDPIAYRIKFHPHQQTGDQWCIYPVYDFVHCLNDAFEEITHSICTLEFNVRRDSYDWLTHVVGGWRPMQWEFSRLNVTHTVMSKRRLLALVEKGHVSGWNDPRMPTLVGLRRRGFTPSVINNFCRLCGVTRNDQLISLQLLELVAKNEYEAEADRCMAVLEPLKIELKDWSGDHSINYPLHPQFPERGSEELILGREFWIDRSSYFDGPAGEKWFSLAEDQVCGLRYGPLLRVAEVVRGAPTATEPRGKIIKLICTHSWDAEVKKQAAAELKKEKKTLLHIHWVPGRGSKRVTVNLYDKLFISEDPMAVADWEADLNPASLVVCREARVPDFVARHCADGEARKIFQFERVGFFVVDEESCAGNPAFNRVVALKGVAH